MAGDPHSFSVVVPVRDDPAGLTACLAALSRQTLSHDDFEVIVVDDGSSRPLSKPAPGLIPRLTIVRTPKSNAFSARNAGASIACGRYLAFCDADCRPAASWLSSLLRLLDDRCVVAGAVAMVLPRRPSTWTLLDLGAYLDQESFVARNRAVTANLAVSRALFWRIGGFDDSQASGGDFDFTERCCADGYELRFAPECIVEHPTRDSARSHLGKLWRDDRSYAARRPETLPRLAVRWIPFGELYWRARTRHPLAVDQHRVRRYGLRPGLTEQARAVSLRYTLLPAWRMAAHLTGFATQSSRRGRGARARGR